MLVILQLNVIGLLKPNEFPPWMFRSKINRRMIKGTLPIIFNARGGKNLYRFSPLTYQVLTVNRIFLVANFDRFFHFHFVIGFETLVVLIN